jgi:methyltransferase family protein
MVAAMVGHPLDHSALDRHRAGHRHRDPHLPHRRERAMRESALPAAHKVGPGGHVLGIDISEPALELARVMARNQGLSNVEFFAALILTFRRARRWRP